MKLSQIVWSDGRLENFGRCGLEFLPVFLKTQGPGGAKVCRGAPPRSNLIWHVLIRESHVKIIYFH